MKYRKICKICLGRGTVADIQEIGRIGKLHFGWTKKVPCVFCDLNAAEIEEDLMTKQKTVH